MALINLIKKKGVNPQTKKTIYFPQWTRRSTDTAMELAEDMAGSTYSPGEITGMLVDFPKRIVRIPRVPDGGPYPDIDFSEIFQ